MDKFAEMAQKEVSLGTVYQLTQQSGRMLAATKAGDTKTMMEILQFVHNTESPLTVYNNEARRRRECINMQLETERLILRPWQESDAENLYQYAKDPAVGPIAGWPAHKSIEESRNVIKNVLCGPECYAICLKTDGVAIGCIEFMLKGHTDMTDRDDECELGYWLGKPFWGRGILPEAAAELIRHGFEDIGMMKIWCGYYEGNSSSKRVQEKLGFQYQWRTDAVDVPLMKEARVGHVSSMTKKAWCESQVRIIRLIDEPERKEEMAAWFHSKWGIPLAAYEESMEECLSRKAAVPQWYAATRGEKLVGGLGVIENDFHDRKDLTPNVCAVYVEEAYRCQGIAGRLLAAVCEDMKQQGIDTLYLLTDHTSFYERYGWEFLCMVLGDGESEMSRMYVHR